jgi:sugar/nucleoside kinase (ribokinase family)
MLSMTCVCSGILFADIACWPISHVPSEGELIPTEKIELNLGGCAANVAMDLARLGVDVMLSGCVGDDALSDFIVRAVSVPKIDITQIQHSAGQCPGTAMHINVQGQDRRFICTTGANDDYVFNDELFQLIEETKSGPKVFYLGGFFMLRALETERTVQFLQTARKNGWTTVLDVVLYGNRPYWDTVKPLLPYTDIFLPNEHEGEKITGERNPYDQAKKFLDAGVGAAIITQGDSGTLYCSAKEQFRAGVYPTNYVSGSGSGDAFDAGLIAALLAGHDHRTAVRWGSALGASCVREVSTTGGVFNRAELLEFLDKHELEFSTVPNRG